MFRIPVYQPDLSGREREYVLDCLDSTWISSKGRYLAEFEAGFAAWTGVSHAAAVCNGTVALHLALAALDIGPGDEVIVPSFTYVATANAVRYVGAQPIFVDSDASTWQPCFDAVAAAVTPRTRAVLAVHLYGGACDVARLRELCDARGLLLVEDCAEAIGTRLHGRHVGTYGDVATFSFFGNKTLTTGEGGMVAARDPEIDRRVRHLRGQGLAPDREYWHDIIGFNYRMTNLCAAIGLGQLERLDAIVAAKQALGRRYTVALAGSRAQLQAPTSGEESSYWMYTLLAPDESRRDAARRALAEAGIETRPTFNPVHRMPMFADARAHCPIADDLAARGMNLPSWHRLPDEAVAEIALILSAALEPASS